MAGEKSKRDDDREPHSTPLDEEIGQSIGALLVALHDADNEQIGGERRDRKSER